MTNLSGDLDNCEVRESLIDGAGLGLFATKFIKKGHRITKFSGSPLPLDMSIPQNNEYLLYVNSKLTLDASGPGHMAGRFIIDSTINGIPTNARFGASRVAYICKVTNRMWSPVMATEDIYPGDEIKVWYGRGVKWTYPPLTNMADDPEAGPDARSDSDHPDTDQDLPPTTKKGNVSLCSTNRISTGTGTGCDII